ncbi:MAG: RNA methyltransferase substrate-binding domain-containing protein, partial [Anaerolineales bacterium]
MSQTEWVYGRNPVLEVLRSGRRAVHRIKIASGAEISGSLSEIVERAEKKGLSMERTPKSDLDCM